MSIYAISDPHLSLQSGKPMDVFGSNWTDHWETIKKDWLQKIKNQDIVVVAGDLSWAIRYEEALADLSAICALPGHKILLKGNHDYWHGSLKKTRKMLFNQTYFIQNDAFAIGGYVFAGTRGWKQRGEETFSAEDEKVYTREAERLSLSLQAASKIEGEIIGVSHYPPFTQDLRASELTKIYKYYGVKTVIYGHLHGPKIKKSEYDNIVIEGTRYLLTSCDYLGFKLLCVRE